MKAMRVLGQASIALAAVVGLAAGGQHASAAPQGPWVHPAADLSAAGQDADDPQITTAPDGTVTAVWSRYDGSNDIIQAATRPPGGTFTAPVDLSDAGQDAEEPQVTTAPDGTATAVWGRFDGSDEIIQAATRPPGGIFGLPEDLSAGGEDARAPQISTVPDGTATAVWYRFDGSDWIIQAATRPPGGSFGAPVDLSANGGNNFRPQITSASGGSATVVWLRVSSRIGIVQAATRPPGGAFGVPIDLSAVDRSAGNPQITEAPDGTATAVWSRSDGSNDIIQAATRPPGGTFTAPVDLSAPGMDAQGPEITTAPDGTTTAVWARSNGSNSITQAATRPPLGFFGAAVDLSVTGQQANSTQITAASDGTVTAVWRRGSLSNGTIQAATRPPGDSFGAPVNLSAGGQSSFIPQIATVPDGSATAVWRRSNGSNYIIQTISTARPSFTLGVTKTGTGGGTVMSSPSGIDCGGVCAESYLSFTKVTLTAAPAGGSTFTGWGGTCGGAAASTCEVTLIDDQEVTAGFGVTTSTKLKITKLKPKKPKVKRGKKVKMKVTGKNVGDAKAKKAKLCLKLAKSVKKKLKPKGKTCQKLGALAPGQAKKKPFKMKATKMAKKGKKYKVKLKLSAVNAETVTRAVKVTVK